MQPNFQVLTPQTTSIILSKAIDLLQSTGVMVGSPEAIELLQSSGAQIQNRIAKIPEDLIQKTLASVPRHFSLFNLAGAATVNYSDDKVHFNPGSSGVNILDPNTLMHRPSQSADLINIIKITEQLAVFDAQSTAVICHDVPEEIGDFYRLLLVLLYSQKPIITGAFSVETSKVMYELLNIASSSSNHANEPRAIFDVCPSPPLNWTHFAAQNLIDLARANIPAQIVSMPLTGAASPVTLVGSIIQHTAECLSGITIHQLANPGAPIVWGGAPAQFDMRFGTTSVGSAETTLIIAGYTQVAKSLNMPTHAYLGATDSKLVDAQAGIESANSAVIGVLSGINMISGPGMLDFLACQSPEKLIIDAEIIANAKRYLKGVDQREEVLELDYYQNFEFPGNFLKDKLTRELYRVEYLQPSPVIDRGSLREWKINHSGDAYARAKAEVPKLLSNYQLPDVSEDSSEEMIELVTFHAERFGMEKLPLMNFE